MRSQKFGEEFAETKDSKLIDLHAALKVQPNKFTELIFEGA